MDIYLTEVEKGARFTFPALPEKITVKSTANYQKYSIIDLGNLNIPRGMDPNIISWDGVFWGEGKAEESYIVKVDNYMKPNECIKQLETWQKEGTVLRLMVTGTAINMDVTISSFPYDYVGGHGNVEYKIEFKQYKWLKIYTTDDLKINKYVKQTKTRPETQATKGDYTIQQGDNLWSIARKFYGGNGSDWKKIYDANVDVIEAAAKKYGKSSSNNGWWIYPDVVLKIPA